MKREYFLDLEDSPKDTALELDSVLQQLAFDQNGLIPVITQDALSNEMLMFAWMNAEALEQTLSTGRVTYWSRSRQQLWLKGETSGHTQRLVSLSIDCDGDAILCRVEQIGAACHTGRRSCFYLDVEPSTRKVFVRQ